MVGVVTFLSLFLGLVLGPQTVEVAVSGPVARVEILLDGELLGEITSEPWTLEADLGRELAPHRLEAVAFDAAGQELDRALQWLNLPRPPAEAQLQLDPGAGGEGRLARLSWESVTATTPLRVSVSFDGRPLPVSDPAQIRLPPFDPAQLHFLRAEVDFSETLSSVAELVFGGTYTDEVTSDLTAVPVLLAAGEELPQLAHLQGWLLKGGEALEVMAAEEGLAEVLVIRDEGSLADLRRIEGQMRRLFRDIATNPGSSGWIRDALPLTADERLRFLSPFPIRQQGSARAFALFPASAEFGTRDGGIYWLLSRVGQPSPEDIPQQLADAVALAGVSAASRSRRRAVLLLLGRRPEDSSQLSPELCRRYLGHLQVPLMVWSLTGKPSEATRGWGAVRAVDLAGRLSTAVEELQDLLTRQRILWVRGTHLPQEITLAPTVEGARLLR